MKFIIFISPFVGIISKRYYSTKLNLKFFMKMTQEKENGQNTTNVHIIAKRHILGGMPTNVEISNTVLHLSLTQEQLNIITSITPYKYFLCNDVKLTRYGIQDIVGRIMNVIPCTLRKAGVYVFTNLKTG